MGLRQLPCTETATPRSLGKALQVGEALQAGEALQVGQRQASEALHVGQRFARWRAAAR